MQGNSRSIEWRGTQFIPTMIVFEKKLVDTIVQVTLALAMMMLINKKGIDIIVRIVLITIPFQIQQGWL